MFVRDGLRKRRKSCYKPKPPAPDVPKDDEKIVGDNPPPAVDRARDDDEADAGAPRSPPVKKRRKRRCKTKQLIQLTNGKNSDDEEYRNAARVPPKIDRSHLKRNRSPSVNPYYERAKSQLYQNYLNISDNDINPNFKNLMMSLDEDQKKKQLEKMFSQCYKETNGNLHKCGLMMRSLQTKDLTINYNRLNKGLKSFIKLMNNKKKNHEKNHKSNIVKINSIKNQKDGINKEYSMQEKKIIELFGTEYLESDMKDLGKYKANVFQTNYVSLSSQSENSEDDDTIRNKTNDYSDQNSTKNSFEISMDNKSYNDQAHTTSHKTNSSNSTPLNKNPFNLLYLRTQLYRLIANKDTNEDIGIIKDPASPIESDQNSTENSFEISMDHKSPNDGILQAHPTSHQLEKDISIQHPANPIKSDQNSTENSFEISMDHKSPNDGILQAHPTSHQLEKDISIQDPANPIKSDQNSTENSFEISMDHKSPNDGILQAHPTSHQLEKDISIQDPANPIKSDQNSTKNSFEISMDHKSPNDGILQAHPTSHQLEKDISIQDPANPIKSDENSTNNSFEISMDHKSPNDGILQAHPTSHKKYSSKSKEILSKPNQHGKKSTSHKLEKDISIQDPANPIKSDQNSTKNSFEISMDHKSPIDGILQAHPTSHQLEKDISIQDLANPIKSDENSTNNSFEISMDHKSPNDGILQAHPTSHKKYSSKSKEILSKPNQHGKKSTSHKLEKDISIQDPANPIKSDQNSTKNSFEISMDHKSPNDGILQAHPTSHKKYSSKSKEILSEPNQHGKKSTSHKLEKDISIQDPANPIKSDRNSTKNSFEISMDHKSPNDGILQAHPTSHKKYSSKSKEILSEPNQHSKKSTSHKLEKDISIQDPANPIKSDENSTKNSFEISMDHKSPNDGILQAHPTSHKKYSSKSKEILSKPNQHSKKSTSHKLEKDISIQDPANPIKSDQNSTKNSFEISMDHKSPNDGILQAHPTSHKKYSSKSKEILSKPNQHGKKSTSHKLEKDISIQDPANPIKSDQNSTKNSFEISMDHKSPNDGILQAHPTSHKKYSSKSKEILSKPNQHGKKSTSHKLEKDISIQGPANPIKSDQNSTKNSFEISMDHKSPNVGILQAHPTSHKKYSSKSKEILSKPNQHSKKSTSHKLEKDISIQDPANPIKSDQNLTKNSFEISMDHKSPKDGILQAHPTSLKKYSSKSKEILSEPNQHGKKSTSHKLEKDISIQDPANPIKSDRNSTKNSFEISMDHKSPNDGILQAHPTSHQKNSSNPKEILSELNQHSKISTSHKLEKDISIQVPVEHGKNKFDNNDTVIKMIYPTTPKSSNVVHHDYNADKNEFGTKTATVEMSSLTVDEVLSIQNDVSKKNVLKNSDTVVEMKSKDFVENSSDQSDDSFKTSELQTPNIVSAMMNSNIPNNVSVEEEMPEDCILNIHNANERIHRTIDNVSSAHNAVKNDFGRDNTTIEMSSLTVDEVSSIQNDVSKKNVLKNSDTVVEMKSKDFVENSSDQSDDSFKTSELQTPNIFTAKMNSNIPNNVSVEEEMPEDCILNIHNANERVQLTIDNISSAHNAVKNDFGRDNTTIEMSSLTVDEVSSIQNDVSKKNVLKNSDTVVEMKSKDFVENSSDQSDDSFKTSELQTPNIVTAMMNSNIPNNVSVEEEMPEDCILNIHNANERIQPTIDNISSDYNADKNEFSTKTTTVEMSSLTVDGVSSLQNNGSQKDVLENSDTVVETKSKDFVENSSDQSDDSFKTSELQTPNIVTARMNSNIPNNVSVEEEMPEDCILNIHNANERIHRTIDNISSARNAVKNDFRRDYTTIDMSSLTVDGVSSLQNNGSQKDVLENSDTVVEMKSKDFVENSSVQSDDSFKTSELQTPNIVTAMMNSNIPKNVSVEEEMPEDCILNIHNANERIQPTIDNISSDYNADKNEFSTKTTTVEMSSLTVDGVSSLQNNGSQKDVLENSDTVVELRNREIVENSSDQSDDSFKTSELQTPNIVTAMMNSNIPNNVSVEEEMPEDCILNIHNANERIHRTIDNISSAHNAVKNDFGRDNTTIEMSSLTVDGVSSLQNNGSQKDVLENSDTVVEMKSKDFVENSSVQSDDSFKTSELQTPNIVTAMMNSNIPNNVSVEEEMPEDCILNIHNANERIQPTIDNISSDYNADKNEFSTKTTTVEMSSLTVDGVSSLQNNGSQKDVLENSDTVVELRNREIVENSSDQSDDSFKTSELQTPNIVTAMMNSNIPNNVSVEEEMPEDCILNVHNANERIQPTIDNISSDYNADKNEFSTKTTTVEMSSLTVDEVSSLQNDVSQKDVLENSDTVVELRNREIVENLSVQSETEDNILRVYDKHPSRISEWQSLKTLNEDIIAYILDTDNMDDLINSFENLLQKEFDNSPIYQAFLSKLICEHLCDTNIIDKPTDLIKKLATCLWNDDFFYKMDNFWELTKFNSIGRLIINLAEVFTKTKYNLFHFARSLISVFIELVEMSSIILIDMKTKFTSFIKAITVYLTQYDENLCVWFKTDSFIDFCSVLTYFEKDYFDKDFENELIVSNAFKYLKSFVKVVFVFTDKYKSTIPVMSDLFGLSENVNYIEETIPSIEVELGNTILDTREPQKKLIHIDGPIDNNVKKSKTMKLDNVETTNPVTESNTKNNHIDKSIQEKTNLNNHCTSNSTRNENALKKVNLVQNGSKFLFYSEFSLLNSFRGRLDMNIINVSFNQNTGLLNKDVSRVENNILKKQIESGDKSIAAQKVSSYMPNKTEPTNIHKNKNVNRKRKRTPKETSIMPVILPSGIGDNPKKIINSNGSSSTSFQSPLNIQSHYSNATNPSTIATNTLPLTKIIQNKTSNMPVQLSSDIRDNPRKIINSNSSIASINLNKYYTNITPNSSSSSFQSSINIQSHYSNATNPSTIATNTLPSAMNIQPNQSVTNELLNSIPNNYFNNVTYIDGHNALNKTTNIGNTYTSPHLPYTSYAHPDTTTSRLQPPFYTQPTSSEYLSIDIHSSNEETLLPPSYEQSIRIAQMNEFPVPQNNYNSNSNSNYNNQMPINSQQDEITVTNIQSFGHNSQDMAANYYANDGCNYYNYSDYGNAVDEDMAANYYANDGCSYYNYSDYGNAVDEGSNY